MIGKLVGVVEHILPKGIILMTASGVGYKISTTSRNVFNVGEKCSLMIHTAVREDALDLYGFSSFQEQELFLLLTSVQGVGNKVGMLILSAYDEAQIYNALVIQDVETFKTISGIGPKLATRIITELKNKVNSIAVSTQPKKQNPILNEAISALTNLGYKQIDILPVIQKLLSENSNLKLEELITKTLKTL